MSLPSSLQLLGAAWSARALREQVLLLVAVGALVWLAADAAWWRPGAADRARLLTEVGQLQSEHDALARQADAAAQQAARVADQERALRERLAVAQQRRQALRSAITPPAEMLQRLRDASGQGSRVTLVALAAEPAERVDGGAAALAGGPAAGAAGVTGATDAGPAATSAAAAAAAAEQRTIYRLPVRVTVQGDYAALRDYLDRLERDAPALRWRHIDLQAQAWPQLRLTLQAFTLAEQGHWAF